MIKNNHGFTLVEMIATITILGIITVIAFPVISGVKGGLTDRKIDIYKESMITASMLYIDSYAEDVFGMEGLTNNECACYNIPLQVLERKNLISAMEIENVTCNENNSYVSVQRKNNVYTYGATLSYQWGGKSYQKIPKESFSCSCNLFQE